MKKQKLIFSGLKKVNSLCFVGLLCALTSVNSFAATGCDSEDNERVNPDIALCATHAYNIGMSSNPETPVDKQEMNDVVALKTTIMTQQMKKQYDYLDVTVRRFKTQLEKSILTAKMEAGGASAGNADKGAGTSSDKNVILAGTENCNNKRSSTEVYDCLRNNYNLIYNMSNGGQTVTADVRKQLAADYSTSLNNKPAGFVKSDVLDKNNNPLPNANCGNTATISNRDMLNSCMQALNTDIRKAAEMIERGNRTPKS